MPSCPRLHVSRESAQRCRAVVMRQYEAKKQKEEQEPQWCCHTPTCTVRHVSQPGAERCRDKAIRWSKAKQRAEETERYHANLHQRLFLTLAPSDTTTPFMKAVFGDANAHLDTERMMSGVGQICDTLAARERTIIMARFLTTTPMTFQALATFFGVSVTRIRSIQAKALRKLRHSSRRNILELSIR